MPKKNSDFSKPYRHQMIYNILFQTSAESALTVSQIHERLIKNDVNCALRTVTRDLDEMSESHKLLAVEEVPNRYYASEDFKPDYQLNFNEEELQTIILALGSLKSMSPEYLKDLCQKTETTLIGKLPKNVSKDFTKLKAMAVSKPSLAGESVSKDKEGFRLVMKALREGKVFECENHSPYKDKEYNTHKRKFAPLLLNMSGGDPYLFVHDENSKTLKKVKVSRLKKVVVLDQAVDKTHLKKIKNLDNSIGGYGGLNEPVTKHIVTCDKDMANFFDEKKIHHSQTIVPKGQHYQITFESNDSLEIIRYLAGFGDQIHDVQPAEVYDKLKSIWRAGLRAA